MHQPAYDNSTNQIQQARYRNVIAYSTAPGSPRFGVLEARPYIRGHMQIRCRW
jgi:hypothetical protein